jgi:hypothetical protein
LLNINNYSKALWIRLETLLAHKTLMQKDLGLILHPAMMAFLETFISLLSDNGLKTISRY